MLSRTNNFNLIRLFAALQVVMAHSLRHLDVPNIYLAKFNRLILMQFPGVPIFFFISGFLIYASASKKTGWRKYGWSRLLRIYPALWVALLVTVVLLLTDYPGPATELLFASQFWVWLGGQLTFLQFYTPEMLRFWGVGAPNGSLWTIGVELQFYLLVPLLLWCFRSLNARVAVVAVLGVLSLAANVYLGARLDSDNLLIKLGHVTLYPFLYYFAIGMAIKQFWPQLRRLFEGTFIYWIVPYLLFQFYAKYRLEVVTTAYYVSSPLQVISAFALAGVVFSAAYSARTLSNRILGDLDISYGVYIYHMLVINWLLYNSYVFGGASMAIVFAVTIVLAYLSWTFVEKPALRLK